MIDDYTTRWVQRYQASVEDAAGTALDEVILAAANRYCAKRRAMRRARTAAIAFAAVSTFAVAALWRVHKADTDLEFAAMHAGELDGLTRNYLLTLDVREPPSPAEGPQ